VLPYLLVLVELKVVEGLPSLELEVLADRPEVDLLASGLLSHQPL
jgi:hypothetical protein